MTTHPVVSPAEWQKSRKAMLEKEKAFTRARDELSAARRQLPWERVEKSYIFDGPSGPESLSDLFAGRSQLVVYHFMFGPDAERGCKSCSFWADNFNGAVPHLAARDVTLIAVSRAPLAKLDALKKRLGWSFKWVSSGNTDFNFDLGVSFRDADRQAGAAVYNYAPLAQGPFKNAPNDLHGISVFFKDESGGLFHSYSTYGRGLDMLNGTYHYLDLVPKGRDEDASPNWVKLHDEYPPSA
jgi:predicted dithiol-disulfide oxidoreductase (DUF899 family)